MTHSVTNSVLAERQERLALAAKTLKSELFGIDDVIDRVIDSVRTWYVLPELINRPVVVCLWGLTGTGKTQLTRRLSQLLGFYDRFIELTMDTSTSVNGYRATSVGSVISESSIEENSPGILVLDEFQRFRTITANGEDVKAERYQDVWTLLSDGKLPPPSEFLVNIERRMAEYHYSAERGDSDEEEQEKKYEFKMDAWDALELKRLLKLKEPLRQIMKWTPEKFYDLYAAYKEQHAEWETNYTKLLIFVCGNLDEMYQETAQRVEDCDTDADIFHRLTNKLTFIDVKKALCGRFKPEQIARLGNEHVVYPSFNRATYEKLIANSCDKFVRDIKEGCGIEFKISQELLDEIYNNAVFPSQGTRPLFSSIHSIVSNSLVRAALWITQNGYDRNRSSLVTISEDKTHLVFEAFDNQGASHLGKFPVLFEVNRIKKRLDPNVKALLAVHEAGHGVAYGLLMGLTPQEIKINIASFEGGFNSFSGMNVVTRQDILNMIAVTMAGRAAELIVFGDNDTTTGACQDLKQATADAAQFIRSYGFGKTVSVTDVTIEVDSKINTNVEPTNQDIETMVRAGLTSAQALLNSNKELFLDLTQELLTRSSLTAKDSHEIFARHGHNLRLVDLQDTQTTVVSGAYDSALQKLLGHDAKTKAVGK